MWTYLIGRDKVQSESEECYECLHGWSVLKELMIILWISLAYIWFGFIATPYFPRLPQIVFLPLQQLLLYSLQNIANAVISDTSFGRDYIVYTQYDDIGTVTIGWYQNSVEKTGTLDIKFGARLDSPSLVLSSFSCSMLVPWLSFWVTLTSLIFGNFGPPTLLSVPYPHNFPFLWPELGQSPLHHWEVLAQSRSMWLNVSAMVIHSTCG